MDCLGTSSIDKLFLQAKASSRLRCHLNLHASYEEKVQRLLIALVQGSYVEPHFHEQTHQWEMFTVLQGVIEVKLYNKFGDIISSKLVGEGRDTLIVSFKPGDIHSVECLSKKALLLEVKEGPFRAEEAKCFPNF